MTKHIKYKVLNVLCKQKHLDGFGKKKLSYPVEKNSVCGGLVILYQKVVLMRQKAVYCKNHRKNLCFTAATMSLLCLQYCSSTLCVVLHAYNNAMNNFILPVRHLQP